MSIGIKVLILLLVMGICFIFMLYYKKKIKLDKYEIYKDITMSVLNCDQKTRRTIEKLCNDYLEHKVINKSIVNKRYLNQANLILDSIKYINVITAIEPKDETEKQLSKIEKAIENNTVISSENAVQKKVPKRGRPKKEDNA